MQAIWSEPRDDGFFDQLCHDLEREIVSAESADGQQVSQPLLYPNYSTNTTQLSHMYGDNLDRLRSIAKSWDKEAVMALAGGWKFQ